MATLKKFTRKEISDQNNKKEIIFIIDNLVYDVSQFLDEHPGGHEVLINVTGKDASEDFDDIGHSLDAKELMKKYQIGEVVDEDKVEVKKRQIKWEEGSTSTKDSKFVGSWKLPLVFGIVITIFYTYLLNNDA